MTSTHRCVVLLIAALVLSLTLQSLSRAADQTVTKRSGSVVKDGELDHDESEADESNPDDTETLPDGNLKIHTKTFKPPNNYKFKKLDDNDPKHVDIIPRSTQEFPAKAEVDKDNEVQLWHVFSPQDANAATFPLMVEGNLRATGNGGGGSQQASEWFWAAKVRSAKKYYLYVTFDDGPWPGTDDCLKALDMKDVVGSFFFVGAHITSNWREQQVIAANAGGHAICNHSFSHPHAPSNYGAAGKTNAEWLADFQANDSELASVLGAAAGTVYVHARLPGKNAWRLPGITKDSGNSKRVADHLSTSGYLIYGWDLEWHYDGNPDASDPKESVEDMVSAIEDMLQNGSSVKDGKVILLTHDHMFKESRGNDVKLHQLIDQLKNSDLSIVFRDISTYLTD